MDDELFEKALKILRELRETLTDEQKEYSKSLAEYLLANAEKKDYEGKQYFPIQDYSRRN